MTVKVSHVEPDSSNQDGGEPSLTITCQNCITKIHKCMSCQDLGQLAANSSISNMIKCAVASCNNYFHKKCAKETTLPDNVKDQI